MIIAINGRSALAIVQTGQYINKKILLITLYNSFSTYCALITFLNCSQSEDLHFHIYTNMHLYCITNIRIQFLKFAPFLQLSLTTKIFEAEVNNNFCLIIKVYNTVFKLLLLIISFYQSKYYQNYNRYGIFETRQNIPQTIYPFGMHLTKDKPSCCLLYLNKYGLKSM